MFLMFRALFRMVFAKLGSQQWVCDPKNVAAYLGFYLAGVSNLVLQPLLLISLFTLTRPSRVKGENYNFNHSVV